MLACWLALRAWRACSGSGAGLRSSLLSSFARVALCPMPLCGECHCSCGGVGVACLVACVLLFCLLRVDPPD